jgi:hypothetical protein
VPVRLRQTYSPVVVFISASYSRLVNKFELFRDPDLEDISFSVTEGATAFWGALAEADE